MAFELDFTIRTRHAMWGGDTSEGDIVIMGVDWSAAAFVMAFATGPGVAAAFTLNNASAGSQGISKTYDAGYVDPETGAVVGATIIRPQIDEATLEAITPWTPAGDPKNYSYDLLVTPSGAGQRIVCFGVATIYPGVGD